MQVLFAIAVFATTAAAIPQAPPPAATVRGTSTEAVPTPTPTPYEAPRPCPVLLYNPEGYYGTGGGWLCEQGTPGHGCTKYIWRKDPPYYICLGGPTP